MADNTLVKIMTALLKHQVKKLVGEDVLGVIGQEITAIGGDKLDEKVKALLGEKTNAEEIEKAAAYALDVFHEDINDENIKQWMKMLPIHNLPAVLTAFEELTEAPDEKHLETAIRESIQLNWKGLSLNQINMAVDVFMRSVRNALLPLEKQTLMVIGRSTLRTEEKVNELIARIDQIFLLLTQQIEIGKSDITSPSLPEIDVLPDDELFDNIIRLPSALFERLVFKFDKNNSIPGREAAQLIRATDLIRLVKSQQDGVANLRNEVQKLTGG